MPPPGHPPRAISGRPTAPSTERASSPSLAAVRRGSPAEYTLTVTDTLTGVQRQYHNPSGRFASVGDTAAF
jgi:hypothetical protein